MNASIVIFLIALLIVAGLLLVVISVTKRGGAQLDIEKYRLKWLKIEKQLVRDQPSSYHLAVLNADKLLDQALRERGSRGATMGERMKSEQSVWSNANAVWTAHKLRNRIAHETDIEVSYESARQALASFKQALKDVGAI